MAGVSLDTFELIHIPHKDTVKGWAALKRYDPNWFDKHQVETMAEIRAHQRQLYGLDHVYTTIRAPDPDTVLQHQIDTLCITLQLMEMATLVVRDRLSSEIIDQMTDDRIDLSHYAPGDIDRYTIHRQLRAYRSYLRYRFGRNSTGPTDPIR